MLYIGSINRNDFMIWLMSDDSSNIIAHQYLNKIAEINNLSIKQIDSINDIPDISFIEDTENINHVS